MAVDFCSTLLPITNKTQGSGSSSVSTQSECSLRLVPVLDDVCHLRGRSCYIIRPAGSAAKSTNKKRACTDVMDEALDIPPPVEYRPPDCSPSSSWLGSDELAAGTCKPLP
jgi:hypothetical protein